MNGEPRPLIPPLEGCLYCHREGTTSLAERRSFLDPASARLLLRCSHCRSVAELDYDPQRADSWRIRYRRTNHDSRYYYMDVHYGKGEWLDAPVALEISRSGFAQRLRVRQAEAGDFSWIDPAPFCAAVALHPHEMMLFELSTVTLREISRAGFFARSNRGQMLDSGRCCVSTQRLHLLGQRLLWAHDLAAVERALYNDRHWLVVVRDSSQWLQYAGVYTEDEADPQLVVTVIDYLALHASG